MDHRTLVTTLIGSLLLLGCPASQNWTTARAIEPSTVQHTVGVEWLGVSIDTEETCDPEVESCIDPEGFVAIPLPAYVLRWGVSEGFDLGFKASASGTVGVDFKAQLVRSEGFDFALDPGFSAFGSQAVYLNLPVLASINLGTAVTVTLAPKASYLLVVTDDADLLGGLFVGGGANIQIRLGDRFAIAPGFDWSVHTVGGEVDGTAQYFSVGIGFSFGGMPQHGAPKPTAPPPATQPAPPPGSQPGYAPPNRPPGY